MKKNLINLSVLCILLCCTFFYACQENIEEEISPDIQELTHPNQVAAKAIKQWFEKNEKELNYWSRSKANLRANSLILPFFEKQPDWSKLHQYRFPDGRKVYEVSLDNNKMVLSPEFKDKFPREAWKENVIQNLMFVQDSLDNSYDLYIARYYPDQVGDTKNFKDISYADLGSEWSGEIALYGFDETHLISFMIKDRKISSTKKYALSPETPKKQYGASSMTNCSIIWQPGPCVPHDEGVGITCYDSYTILCEGEPQSYFEVSTDYQDGIGGGSYNPGDGPGDDEGEETIEEPELLPPPDFAPYTSFGFPENPVDGQTHTFTYANGDEVTFTYNSELDGWLMPEVQNLLDQGYALQFPENTPPSFNGQVITLVALPALAEPTFLGEIVLAGVATYVTTVYVYEVLDFYFATYNRTYTRDECIDIYVSNCYDPNCSQCLQYCIVQGKWDEINCPGVVN